MVGVIEVEGGKRNKPRRKRKRTRRNSRKDTGFVQCGNTEVGQKRRDDKKEGE